MKKLIAGAALITTILSTGSAALAETAPVTTQTNVTATAQPATTETTVNTTAAPTTATEAPATTTATETTAPATTETTVSLPEVSLTPDKLFYGLKLWFESIKVTLTRDAAEKAALLEAQAQTRLAEAKAMADAGKTDLAQKALEEAKAKLAEAQKAIEAAQAAEKDITKLQTAVAEDQAKFAIVLTGVMEKMPEEVKVQMEPVVAELLIQVASNQDTVTQDEEIKEEAEKVAEEAAELKEKLEGLQPRMVLVLKAMADASGKDLKDVVAMYKKHPGLGVLAKQLGVKMGTVQHMAQADWKKAQAGGTIEIVIESATKPEAETTATTDVKVAVETKTEPVTIGTKGIKLSLKTADLDDADEDDEDDEDDDDKEFGRKQDKEKGKGNNGKAKGHEKNKK